MLRRVLIVFLLNQSIYCQLNLIGVEIPYTDKLLDVITTNKKCVPSVTVFTNDEHPCKNQLIFEDNFEGSFLNTKKWAVEQYTPIVNGVPDYEFVSYEANDDTLFINNSRLVINPVAIDDEAKLRGILDIREGCTSMVAEQCYYEQIGGNILPPVKSAQISSKFAFTYGKIEIKVKLPLGDWIYPKIELLPRTKSKSGGKMWVAYSRGNSYYIGPNGDVGSTILQGGLVLGTEEPGRSRLATKRKSVTPYGEESYTYGLIWEPGQVTLTFNNNSYGVCPIDQTSSRFAPFANEFYLSIGVGVGGINDFPDNYTTNNPKPWGNQDTLQLKKFFEARHSWLPTWKKHNIQMEIDSVKIWAL